jgi:hypothetical protein
VTQGKNYLLLTSRVGDSKWRYYRGLQERIGAKKTIALRIGG